VLSGYRGLLRELGRTGRRALALQLRTGILHVLRRAWGPRDGDDPVRRVLEQYAADGLGPADPRRAERQLAAEACLTCGLCTAECARAGGAPRLDPRDAVVAAARLEIDWRRLRLPAAPATPCAGCRACELVCPVAIPIAEIQEALAQPA
jgi:ferredoxin